MRSSSERYQPLDDLLGRLKITVKDIGLFLAAITYPSFFGEVGQKGTTNEALEFLGTRVISLAVAAYLRRRFPEHTRHGLALIHDQLTRERALERAAAGMRLEQVLRLGKGHWGSFQTDPTTRANVMAQTFRALVGAIFEEQGFGSAARIIDSFLMVHLEDVMREANNPKSDLQNYIQGTLQYKYTPRYRVLKVEPSNGGKKFYVSVEVKGLQIATGEGSSRQRAEVHGASQALLLKEIWSTKLPPVVEDSDD